MWSFLFFPPSSFCLHVDNSFICGAADTPRTYLKEVFDMKKTLRDLFFGNLVIQEHPIDRKSRYYMAACAANIVAKKLKKTLTTELKSIWEEYSSRAA